MRPSAVGSPVKCVMLGAVTLAPWLWLHGQDALPVPSAELGVIRCTVGSSVPLVRIEGASELVGDVLLTCHNVAPAIGFDPRGFVQADVSLSLNVDVANRVGYGLGAEVSDAVLVVNEKNCPLSSAHRTFSSCGSGNDTVQDPLPGLIVGGLARTLRWERVAIPIPGAAIGSEAGGAEPATDCSGRFGVPGGCHPLTTTVRLTNIRVNAASLGATGGGSTAAVPVEAYVSVDAEDGTVQLENARVRVAEAAPGMASTVQALDADRLCSHGETTAEVSISEGFAAAFKTAAEATYHPGDPGWSEGYYPAADSVPGATPARSGTRVSIALAGLPDGIDVEAPGTIACSSPSGPATLELGLVAGASADGRGGSVRSGPSRGQRLSSEISSEVVAVYEVTRASQLAREECRIPFRLSRSDGANGFPIGGIVTVSTRLAPIGSPVADGSGRQLFAFSRPAVMPSFPLRACGTTLFFPFVTNRSNFDTAIVIANTSADPLGSRYQSGRCTLRYHGSGVAGQTEPSIQNTVELTAGKQLAFTLSSGNASQGITPLTDFQGYLVTECEFQHAQGFAFVTEQVNGAAILAQGYLAEIVRDSKAGDSDPSPP